MAIYRLTLRHPELHRSAALAAYEQGISLNQYVAKAISDELVRQA